MGEFSPTAVPEGRANSTNDDLPSPHQAMQTGSPACGAAGGNALAPPPPPKYESLFAQVRFASMCKHDCTHLLLSFPVPVVSDLGEM